MTHVSERMAQSRRRAYGFSNFLPSPAPHAWGGHAQIALRTLESFVGLAINTLGN